METSMRNAIRVLLSIVCFCGSVNAEETDEKGERTQVGGRKGERREWVAEEKEKEQQDLLPQSDRCADLLSDVNRTTYYSSYTDIFHHPIAISFTGDTIELEDGSIWTVQLQDRFLTINWLTTDLLVIIPNRSHVFYEYRLVNINTGISVGVDLTVGPFVNGLFTHWIVAMDKLWQQIWLEDGSIWEMSWFDRNIVNQWYVGDVVILGINDDFFTSDSNPNIIINVQTDNYAMGRCILE